MVNLCRYLTRQANEAYHIPPQAKQTQEAFIIPLDDAHKRD